MGLCMRHFKLIIIMAIISTFVIVSCTPVTGGQRPSGAHKKHRNGFVIASSRNTDVAESGSDAANPSDAEIPSVAESAGSELVDASAATDSSEKEGVTGNGVAPEPGAVIEDVATESEPEVVAVVTRQETDAEILERRKNITMNQNVMEDTSNIKLTTGKILSIPRQGASESPRSDRIHDTDNIAITILQNPVKAMANFPRDRRQQVDWVKTLDQGLIEPRADIKGETTMLTLDKDILMKNTQFMPFVKFPHLQHTRWLACSNCHPKIFIPKENANPISMNKVLRGEYCGVCHDKVAFAIFTCERCHSVPHEGSGPKWW